MHTIFIDGSLYASSRELHLALKVLLNLPSHYGCNADALYDCLSERAQAVNVVVLSPGEGETADALRKCLMVFEDLGGSIKHAVKHA